MTQEAEGVRVVLSPVQLAAVLADESIPEDAIWTNRLWGGLRLVGGVAELAGAGVLCLAPGPTMATKVGCVVFGLHGADTTATGARQVLSGRDIQSLAHSGTAALATALGASPGIAHAIGMTVGIAVPFAVASWVGAVRVASIRAGCICATLAKPIAEDVQDPDCAQAENLQQHAVLHPDGIPGPLTDAAHAMKYPHLDTLIKAYLNQDYSYYADTLEGVIEAYKDDAAPEQIQGLRADVARFLADHPATLDAAFEAAYGFDFGPELWGLTTEGFLKKLDGQLQGAGEP